MNESSERASELLKLAEHVAEILRSRRRIDVEQQDALGLALLDIALSFHRVYDELLPQIMDSGTRSDEELDDLLFEMRSDFRHIEYHIKDARLDEWFW